MNIHTRVETVVYACVLQYTPGIRTNGGNGQRHTARPAHLENLIGPVDDKNLSKPINRRKMMRRKGKGSPLKFTILYLPRTRDIYTIYVYIYICIMCVLCHTYLYVSQRLNVSVIYSEPAQPPLYTICKYMNVRGRTYRVLGGAHVCANLMSDPICRHRPSVRRVC